MRWLAVLAVSLGLGGCVTDGDEIETGTLREITHKGRVYTVFTKPDLPDHIIRVGLKGDRLRGSEYETVRMFVDEKVSPLLCKPGTKLATDSTERMGGWAGPRTGFADFKGEWIMEFPCK